MSNQPRYQNVQCKNSFDNHRSSHGSSEHMTCFAGQIKLKVSSSIRHQSLGHSTSSILDLVVKSNNMNVLSDLQHCEACAIGKRCKLPFTDSQSVYSYPLELVEIDLWGPTPVSSNGCV